METAVIDRLVAMMQR